MLLYVGFFLKSIGENVHQSLHLPSTAHENIAVLSYALPCIHPHVGVKLCRNQCWQDWYWFPWACLLLTLNWIFFPLTMSLLSTGNANAAVFPTEGFLNPGPSWRVALCWLHSSGMKFLFCIYCLYLIEGKGWLCSLSGWIFVRLASRSSYLTPSLQLPSCAFPCMK